MKGLRFATMALTALVAVHAFASWTVSVQNSQGSVFQPGPGFTNFNVPVVVNANPPQLPPFTITVTSLPQVTFLLVGSNPPLIAGDGLPYTAGYFTGQYTINSTTTPLTGFDFVIQGFVQDLGQIVWTKKVIDSDTNDVLYFESGSYSGDGYPGGSDRTFSDLIQVPRSECAGTGDRLPPHRWGDGTRNLCCLFSPTPARLGA